MVFGCLQRGSFARGRGHMEMKGEHEKAELRKVVQVIVGFNTESHLLA